MRRADARRVAVSDTYIWIPSARQRFAGQCRAYPELSALVGSTVPDLRGLFLRGYGSQSYAQNNGSTVGVTSTLHTSGQLGQVQGDATRKITGQVSNVGAVYGHSSSGAMRSTTQFGYANDYDGSKDDPGILIQIDSDRIVPTSTEDRPVNMAVRYLMRALP